MTLTVFDLITLTVITVSTVLGLYRGAISIFINFAGFIASLILAYCLFPYTKSFFTEYISNELLITIVAVLVSYVISLILFTFLVSKILAFFAFIVGGFFDRSFGFIIGLMRGIFFALIVYIISAVFSSGIYLKAENLRQLFTDLNQDDYPDWLKKAITTEYYDNATKSIIQLIPEDRLSSIKLPSSDEEEDQEKDIINAIKKKKNPNGVSSTIDIPFNEELEKSIDELKE